jgi:hypothetical protein
MPSMCCMNSFGMQLRHPVMPKAKKGPECMPYRRGTADHQNGRGTAECRNRGRISRGFALTPTQFHRISPECVRLRNAPRCTRKDGDAHYWRLSDSPSVSDYFIRRVVGPVTVRGSTGQGPLMKRSGPVRIPDLTSDGEPGLELF